MGLTRVCAWVRAVDLGHREVLPLAVERELPAHAANERVVGADLRPSVSQGLLGGTGAAENRGEELSRSGRLEPAHRRLLRQQCGHRVAWVAAGEERLLALAAPVAEHERPVEDP